jgi:hypothetical protein
MQHAGLIIGIVILLAIIVVVALGAYYIYSKTFDLGAGATCRLDVECASNDCKGNWGGLKRGTCTAAPAPAGGNCTEDSNCASGLFCVSNICTAPQPNGSACAENAECASGDCFSNVCQSPGPPGEVCKQNADCVSGNCAWYGRPVYMACCPTSSWSTYWLEPYCTNLPNGDPCEAHGMCASGNCASNGICVAASARRGR